MNKIEFNLENCYGIKKFRHTFDFTASKTHLVYAPNGVMKSSFAKTVEDIALGKASKDRIFSERVTHRDVKVDGKDILADEIFVIQRMKQVDFKEASTILVNENLKNSYDLLNSKLNETKVDFLKTLQSYFGLKAGQIETEIIKIYGGSLLTIFEKIESTVSEISEPLYTDIIYNEVFNDKVIKFLENKDFKTKIKEYIEVYDKLVNENNSLFRKGKFNHYNADVVSKSLRDNNFFSPSHKVKINDVEIEDISGLEALIQLEKDKVLSNPELTSKFNEIDKSLNGNLELRKFRSYIEGNKDIIKEFVDLKNFSKKLTLNYIAIHKDEFNILLKLYQDTKKNREEIIEEAKKEHNDWKKVIDIFVRRFSVPFKVKIKNQEDVILKNEPASLIFEYNDGDSVKELGGTELQESLSTGEQRVFYLLNIIFQIEIRRKLNINQLIIVDDIADSFDYKNKYAIIEYLKDVLEDDHFFMIILTHNFDFYKTIKSRLGGKINHQGNWRSIKRVNEITLEIGEKRDVFPILRNNYGKCDFTFIACIPFVRNLIEFTVGSDDEKYYLLTSLLHLKPVNQEQNIKATRDITKGDVFDIFNTVFGLNAICDTPGVLVHNLIMDKAEEIFNDQSDVALDIKSKITLSLAIRLNAEEFMLNKILDINFHSNILKKQTGHIVGQYKKEFPDNLEEMGLLDRVNLMTPENIHVNSFMYEPLMDLSDDHLIKLFEDLKTLN